jgi:hypothetical protein
MHLEFLHNQRHYRDWVTHWNRKHDLGQHHLLMKNQRLVVRGRGRGRGTVKISDTCLSAFQSARGGRTEGANAVWQCCEVHAPFDHGEATVRRIPKYSSHSDGGFIEVVSGRSWPRAARQLTATSDGSHSDCGH